MNRGNGWSPNEKFWVELTSIDENLTWKCVNLDKTRKHLVPGDTGVYLMCAHPPRNVMKALQLYTVIYAGQAKKRGLQTRFLEHINVNQPNSKLRMFLKCYYATVDFWFALVHEQTEIDRLEVLLIETFNPPCNTIGAPGSRPLIARLGNERPIGRGITRNHS